MSSLQKNVLKSKLPPMGLPPKGTSASSLVGRRGPGRQRDFSPIHWSKYFSSQEDVIAGRDTFRVYRHGNKGPLMILLHGGGYSALTWASLATQLSELVHCQILAIDLRGHGSSISPESSSLDIDTMSRDVISVVQSLFQDSAPSIVLVGHSMGGAIAVHTAILEQLPVVGLVVIDVVEGSAMDALASMQSFLRSRPKSFASPTVAIEWSLKSGQVRNLESARVSMPGQLKNIVSGQCASDEVECNETPQNLPTPTTVSVRDLKHGEVIQEEEEGVGCEFKEPTSQACKSNLGYSWRIDLTETEPYWQGWFQGLSNKFLNAKAAKLLLLAGIDRLDRDLTVGQMQGKFQMQVLPQCGHAVHEDVPDKVAEVLASYLLRNRLTTAKCEFQRVFPAC